MRLRTATGDDAAAVHAIYAPVVANTVISFEDDPPPVEEIARRIEAITARYPWLVAEDEDGTFLGYAYASGHRGRSAYRWAVETSVYVADHARRRGVARRLYDALHPVLTHQGFGQAYAGIALPNPASVALHESFGYEQVALYRAVGYKLGAWRDVVWLGRPLAGDRPEPSEPTPFPTLSPALVTRLLGG